MAIADGHPHAVLQSIKIAMNLSIMQGLWQTLKGAGNIGLAFATWGVSMIVGLVTSLTEMVVKVLWRIVETIKMKKVCAAANEYWRARGGPNALHTRPFAFHNWFRESVLLLPALAVLTLNSGICGDKMVWLSMFSNGAQISTAEFQKGSEYVDSLKPWGTDYLESCGFSFFSSEPLVAKVVNLTHEARMSGAEKVWSTVVKVAKA